MKNKFFVIDYRYDEEADYDPNNPGNTSFKTVLFSWRDQQAEAEAFCKLVKEHGGVTNIRIRDIVIPE